MSVMGNAIGEERALMTILSPSGDHQASKFSPCSRIEVGVLERKAKAAAGWSLLSL